MKKNLKYFVLTLICAWALSGCSSIPAYEAEICSDQIICDATLIPATLTVIAINAHELVLGQGVVACTKLTLNPEDLAKFNVRNILTFYYKKKVGGWCEPNDQSTYDIKVNVGDGLDSQEFSLNVSAEQLNK